MLVLIFVLVVLVSGKNKFNSYSVKLKVDLGPQDKKEFDKNQIKGKSSRFV